MVIAALNAIKGTPRPHMPFVRMADVKVRVAHEAGHSLDHPGGETNILVHVTNAWANGGFGFGCVDVAMWKWVDGLRDLVLNSRHGASPMDG